MASVEEFYYYLLKAYPNRIVDSFYIEPELFELVSYKFPESIKEKIASLGIEKLFKHQAEAIDSIFNEKNVILVSPTASGKSLVYIIPIVSRFIEDSNSTFLLIYPTKALAQDQIKTVKNVISEAEPAVYDGDTPTYIRSIIRKRSHIIATNPDMLHYGILPNHEKWGNFLKNLKLVVIDEGHVYRGAFGANAAFVFRRLLRLAKHYGGSPQVVITSATIANPEEFAKKLTGLDFEVIINKGLSRFLKWFIFWNPPFDIGKSRRLSPNRDAAAVFSAAIEFGLRTIVFSKSKQTAELIAKYASERLEPEKRKKIAVYRAGLTAQSRREIERALFSGRMLGVSATPALELGIDIGDLSVCVINRFPGTISSFLQEAGRVGRKKESLVVFIAGEDPLDQYYINLGREMFTLPREEAVIDLTNKYIGNAHLLSAAYELPIKIEELFNSFGDNAEQILERAKSNGSLFIKKDFIYVRPELRRPHATISLRSASNNAYQIIEIVSGELIGYIEEPLAFIYLHPGAVYMHEMQTYLVKDLDIEKRKALVEPVDEIDYYTVALTDTNVEIIKTERFRKYKGFDVFFGELRVVNHVYGFKKKHSLTEETIGFESLNLPPMEFETKGFWFEFNENKIKEDRLFPDDLAGGIHAIEHAHIALLPIYAGCDRWDIGGVSNPKYFETGKPTIFIYDGYEGGIGFSEKGFEKFEEHIEQTLNLIENCECESGCPSCVVSPKCGNNNEPLNKEASIKLLKSHLSYT